MDQNQLVIQALKGADPTMVHQAPEPNPVPNIVDAFKAFGSGGLQGLANQQGVQTPDWSQKLGSYLSSPEANAALGALRLKQIEGPAPAVRKTSPTSDFYHMVDKDTMKHAGEVMADWDPRKKHVDLSIWSNEGPNQYGYSQMRDIINQIKNEYPKAKTVGGTRETGARAFWNKSDRDMTLKVR